MNAFFVALNAVFPFLVYLTLGYFIRTIGSADEPFFRRLNGIIFHYFFPCLLFANIYNIDPDIHADLRIVLWAAGSIIAVIIVSMLAVPRIVRGNPQRGVIVQAIYRSNFVLYAVPIAASVCGEQGSVTASMLIALIVPLFNLSAVLVLSWFGGTKPEPGRIFRDMITNPLILGAVVGFLFRMLGIDLPQMVRGPINAISSMSTPLALIVLGGTLEFPDLKRNMHYILPVCIIRLLVLPLIATLLMLPAGLDPVNRFVILVMFAAPVATSSYTMAQMMGGDGPLAGELVVMTTVFSLFTLFFWVFLYGILGLL